MGISTPSVWDIEQYEDELVDCYSPIQVRQFSLVLGIHPSDLFDVRKAESPVTAGELVRLIQEQCRSSGVGLEQFEEAVGWRLSACVEPPERLFEEITIRGVQRLCQELGIHWHGVILALC